MFDDTVMMDANFFPSKCDSSKIYSLVSARQLSSVYYCKQ